VGSKKNLFSFAFLDGKDSKYAYILRRVNRKEMFEDPEMIRNN
jgi:hypothetical protein